jgi:hypothetical protein
MQRVNLISVAASPKRFVPPSLEEVVFDCSKIGLPSAEGEKFFYFYDAVNWHVGKAKMRVWRSALAGWKLRWQERQSREKVRQETPSANVNIIRWQNELERVEKKIESIRASYAAFQTWEQGDRNLVNCLKKRRTELLEKLGMAV